MPVQRSKSAKKSSPLELAKEELASQQGEIEELTSRVVSLTDTLTEKRAEVHRLRSKLNTLIPEILSHRDREKFPLDPVDDPIDIDAEYIREMVYMLVDDLYIRKDGKTLTEQRVEQLETRVTEQSLKYQSIVRKNMICMNGLEEALESNKPDEIRGVLTRLKQDLVLEKPVYQCSDNVPLFSLPHRAPQSSHALEIIRAMETTPFTLTKPLRKQSGDTHITYLIPEIQDAICNELSLEKQTGGDWRLFAIRVGISPETIEFWKRLKVRNPMCQVLTFWKDSKGATVRMLHRHLKSPPIHAVILTKIISDFYQVD